MIKRNDKKGNGSAEHDALPDPYVEERARMVEDQIRRRGVRDPAVIRALERVPRHLFVRPQDVAFAHDDTPAPIGHGQTISQPYIVALMTEILELKPTDRVLEIGTGSGYQAAVLSLVAKEVFTLEYVAALGMEAKKRLAALGYSNVHVRFGDGYRGWPEEAPFDAIMVTAAPERVPQTLLDQLKDGGRMAIPVGAFFQELLRVVKVGGRAIEEKICDVRFVPMVGREK